MSSTLGRVVCPAAPRDVRHITIAPAIAHALRMRATIAASCGKCRIIRGPLPIGACAMTQMMNPATAKTSGNVEQVQMLSGGKWINSTSTRFGDVYNPSTGQVIARVPFCTADEVNKVIETAAAALPKWAALPVVQRCHFLFKFRELLTQHAEDIARCVTREHGKTIVE